MIFSIIYQSLFIDQLFFNNPSISYRDKNAETSTVRVGFATFDKQIHFYNIKVRPLKKQQLNSIYNNLFFHKFLSSRGQVEFSMFFFMSINVV